MNTNIKEQIELKIFKTSAHRILLMMLQDRYLKDSLKLINGTKEFKGNILKSLLQQTDDFTSPSELNLISKIFNKDSFEESKLISMTLQELSRRVRDLKEQLLQKRSTRDFTRELRSINKLVYLICTHEANSAMSNQLSP